MIVLNVFTAVFTPLLARIPQGLRQSLLMVFGNAAGQGFSAISLILITRALGPNYFGQFSVGFAIVLILVRLNDLGMTFAVQKYAPRAKSHEDANRLFSYTLKIKLIAAGVIALIGILGGGWLAQVLNFESSNIISTAFIVSAATVLYEHFQTMLQSLHRFGQSVVANTIQAVAKFGGAIVLIFTTGTWYLFGLDLPFIRIWPPQAPPLEISEEQSWAMGIPYDMQSGIVLATYVIFCWYMLAPLIPFVLGFRKLFPDWVRLSLKGSFAKENTLVRSLATHSAVGFIATGVIENIDILFVQGYLDTYEAGLLGGVSRIALLFNLMAFSLGTVLNPRAAKYQNPKELQSFIKKGWLLVGASLLGFLALVPFADQIILLTIGQQYASGSGILVILLGSAFLSMAVMPFIAVFFSVEVPWYFSVSGVLQLLIVVIGNAVFVPLYGLEAAAWTRLVARAALFVMTVGIALWAFRCMKLQHSTQNYTSM